LQGTVAGVHFQLYPEICHHTVRQSYKSDDSLGTWGYGTTIIGIHVVGGKITPSENFKSLGSKSKLLECSFVVGARQERHSNVEYDLIARTCNGAFAKRLAPNTVRPTGSLFKHRRIPRQIEMYDVPAVAVEINAFLPDSGAN
jgi:hypothetical protein